jgi:outer membrane murein-binding lipoprotein Lpp
MDERAATPPPILGFDALADRIEYIHTEHKSARAEQATVNVSIDKRVSKLEFLDEQKDARLNGGAATFAKLEAQIEKVNAKIDWPWWKVLATVAPAILLILTWVWQLSRYPDDTKFEALKAEVQDMKVQQVKFEGKLSNIEASQQAQAQVSAESNKKLDTILLRQTVGNPVP